MKPVATVSGLSVLVVALTAALVIKSCDKPSGPNIPPDLQRSIDSLATTEAPTTKTRDSVIRIVIHDTLQATLANARAEKARKSADAMQDAADSLAAIARQNAETAGSWYQAFEAQGRVSDSLRVALVSSDSAYRSERDARVNLLLTVHQDTLRMNAIADANRRLVARVGELETSCRVIGPIKCPSRTVTMLVTTAILVGANAASK